MDRAIGRAAQIVGPTSTDGEDTMWNLAKKFPDPFEPADAKDRAQLVRFFVRECEQFNTVGAMLVAFDVWDERVRPIRREEEGFHSSYLTSAYNEAALKSSSDERSKGALKMAAGGEKPNDLPLVEKLIGLCPAAPMTAWLISAVPPDSTPASSWVEKWVEKNLQGRVKILFESQAEAESICQTHRQNDDKGIELGLVEVKLLKGVPKLQLSILRSSDRRVIVGSKCRWIPLTEDWKRAADDERAVPIPTFLCQCEPAV